MEIVADDETREKSDDFTTDKIKRKQMGKVSASRERIPNLRCWKNEGDNAEEEKNEIAIGIRMNRERKK